MPTMIINATIIGTDEWIRVVIKTERGTQLCDINCHDQDVIEKDPSVGDWHTMSPDLGEPESRIRSDIKINLIPRQ